MTDWVRVPIGPGSEPYKSVHFERTVLVIARTAGTTYWLLDFLAEILADRRIQVVFTVESKAPSVYHHGAHDLLKSVGAAIIPWQQAITTSFDLVISSTHNGSLSDLQSPLFITPHGPGFGKPASVPTLGATPVPRAVPDRIVDRNLPWTTVVLSHPGQRVLFADHTHRVGFLVAGDPAYDKLLASKPFRRRYRHALGIRDRKWLVVLSSTWSVTSQFGALPELPTRLLGDLPADEFQLAMIIHPNVWYGHSAWQVRAWLGVAERAGVLLVPPADDSWRAAVLAADLLIADHGSVAFYAAALGVPVVRAGFRDAALIADSPMAELGRRAPRLDLDADLAAQVRSAIDNHDPNAYQVLAQSMFANVGFSLDAMQSSIYELLDLTTPAARPRVRAIGIPSASARSASACVVVASFAVSDGDDEGEVLSLKRFPALYPPPPRVSGVCVLGRGGVRNRSRACPYRGCHRRGVAPRGRPGSTSLGVGHPHYLARGPRGCFARSRRHCSRPVPQPTGSVASDNQRR